ncbi:MAG: hypothetical protein ACREQB_08820, partial [Candidatus Binataceae bacterium]
MRGSFSRHPGRRRKDAPGAGPFNPEPPEHLTGEEQAAWREIVGLLPQFAVSASEQLGIEQMARLRAALKNAHPASPDFVKLDNALRQWATQMGMTLTARVRLGSGSGQRVPCVFDELK